MNELSNESIETFTEIKLNCFKVETEQILLALNSFNYCQPQSSSN